MAHTHNNELRDHELFNIQAIETPRNLTTFRSYNTSRTGTEYSQDHHVDSMYQPLQDDHFQNLSDSNDITSIDHLDWLTLASGSHEQTPSGISDVSSMTHHTEQDETSYPQIVTPQGNAMITTNPVSQSPQFQISSDDTPIERPRTVRSRLKGTQKTKTKKATTTTKYLTEAERRGKILNRNRAAATKCRKRKKEWTVRLEEEARNLQQKRNILSQSVTNMKDELLYLKGEILRHSACYSPEIKAYLDVQAYKFAGMSNPYSYHTPNLPFSSSTNNKR